MGSPHTVAGDAPEQHRAMMTDDDDKNNMIDGNEIKMNCLRECKTRKTKQHATSHSMHKFMIYNLYAYLYGVIHWNLSSKITKFSLSSIVPDDISDI